MKNVILPIAAKCSKPALLFLLLLLALSSGAATFSVWPGETQRVEVSVSAGDTSPSWSTTNPTLRLSGSGFYRDVTATAYFGGTATVTCTYTYRLGTSQYKRSKSWTFTCMSNNVSVTPTSVTLDAGETKQLSWGFSHATYMNPTMQFTSDDPDVAYVSGDGIITAKGKGTTTIYVRSNMGTNSATCRVTVTDSGAQDDGNTPGGETSGTKRTIHLKEAGTLDEFISSADKYEITELVLSGPINGTDLRLLRDMAGCDHERKKTNGRLKVLDLRDALIVAGGQWYVKYGSTFRTENTDFDFPERAFDSCDKLTHVYLPHYFRALGSYSFSLCKNLVHIELPVGLNNIYSEALYACEKMRTLTLPSTVSTIHFGFSYMDALTEIYSYAKEPPTLYWSVINESMENGILHVSEGRLDQYNNAFGWNSVGAILDDIKQCYALRLTTSVGGTVQYSENVVEKEFPDIDYDGKRNFDIPEGEDVELTITPDAGYVLDKVLLNGIDVTSDVSGNTLVINSVDEVKRVDVSFRLSTGIDEVVDRNAGEDVKAFCSEGGIVITGASAGERIDVYSASGVKVVTDYATGDETRVALPGSGVYIVKVGAVLSKVMLCE